jgi:alpha-L-rhamnosidase
MDWVGGWIKAPEGVGGLARSAPTLTLPRSTGGGEARVGLPLFRRVFHVRGEVLRARVFVCGLGQFELRVNGGKVGEDVLEPGWTDYRKRCLYVVRDVTSYLRERENVIGVMLGNGMYNVVGAKGRYTKFKGSFGPPKVIADVRVEYADGRVDVVGTDGEWKVSAGPIVFSCIYGGEDYDARREASGWDAPGFSDGHWAAAEECEGPGGVLEEQSIPGVRVMERLEAVRVTEPRAGVRVFDVGRNISGWPRVRVRGAPRGLVVKMVTGELLDEEGCVTQRNTGKGVWFSYTARGAEEGGNDEGRMTKDETGGSEMGEGDPDRRIAMRSFGPAWEEWAPRFSYTGFRYVQVEGVPEGVEVEVMGEWVHSSARRVGSFRCSNALLNRVHELIVSAVRSNTQSIFTDCPHREKLGWLEQTHLMGRSVMCNFDVARLCAKVCRDMRDAQDDRGCVPTIAPQYTRFDPPWDVFNDSPEWGSAMVIVPWLVYARYGDRGILEDNWGAMGRYVEYLGTRAAGSLREPLARLEESGIGIVDYGLGDWYDIGPGDPGFAKLTSRGVTATGIYYLDLVIMQKAARVLGREEEAREYRMRARRVRDAFNARFFNAETGQYDTGSQCANGMALALGVVPRQCRGLVLENLVRDIRYHGNHITAGDVGFGFVLQALAEGGRSDVVFDVLRRTDPPSYGYQLAQGATALTEAWDANRKVSQNHMMLGHAEAWFYEWLVGIRVDLTQLPPGRILIDPQPVGDVSWAEAGYDSVLGRITCRWERVVDRRASHSPPATRSAGGENERLRMEVEVPAGAAATVRVPGAEMRAMRVGGVPAHEAPGVMSVRREAGGAVLEVMAGVYEIEAETLR